MKTLLILLLLCTPAFAQATWGNRQYNSRVCSNASCQMCASIEAQLTTPTQTTRQVKRCSNGKCWYETVTEYVPANQTQPQSPITQYQTQLQTTTVTKYPTTGTSSPQLQTTQYQTQLPIITPTTATFAQAPTPYEAIPHLLPLLTPETGEVFADLGCGDGRVLLAAVQTFDVPSVGIEIAPTNVLSAISCLNLQDKINIYRGDILSYDLKNLDIVYMYLYPDLIMQVLPKLHSGTRVVSYMHSIPGSTTHHFNSHTFYTWTKP